MIKAMKSSLMLLIFASLIAGCSEPEAPSGKVKIMVENEEAFNRSYGRVFNALYPDIQVEVIETSSKKLASDLDGNKSLEAYIESERPDVLMLNKQQFQYLASDNRLAGLNPILQDKRFRSEDILPSVLQVLRHLGGGELYGLAPTFSGDAIYYNRNLFDRYGIEVPSGTLTWSEMLSIAMRFPVDGGGSDKTFGFQWGSSDPFQLAIVIGINQGLDFADPAREKLMMDTPEWKEIFDIVTQAYKSGVIYDPSLSEEAGIDLQNAVTRDPFVLGKAALSIGGPKIGYEIGQAKRLIKDYPSFDWGVVAGPIDPANPSYGGITLNSIYAVRANADNYEAAMELIAFINGDSTAKSLSRIDTGYLQSRTRYNTNDDGVSYEPFYALQIREQSLNIQMPIGFNEPFYKIAGKELQKVVNGEHSLDAAMDNIQLEGQFELDKANMLEELKVPAN